MVEVLNVKMYLGKGSDNLRTEVRSRRIFKKLDTVLEAMSIFESLSPKLTVLTDSRQSLLGFGA